MSAEVEEIRLQIPSDPYYFRTVRALLQAFGRRAGMNFEEIGDMQIVAGELLANIHIHAYARDGASPVIVRLVNEADRLRMFIRDFGRRADLSTFRSRDLSEYREGGIGLYMVKSLAHFVHYNRAQKVGTEVEVIFLKNG